MPVESSLVINYDRDPHPVRLRGKAADSVFAALRGVGPTPFAFPVQDHQEAAYIAAALNSYYGRIHEENSSRARVGALAERFAAWFHALPAAVE